MAELVIKVTKIIKTHITDTFTISEDSELHGLSEKEIKERLEQGLIFIREEVDEDGNKKNVLYATYNKENTRTVSEYSSITTGVDGYMVE